MKPIYQTKNRVFFVKPINYTLLRGSSKTILFSSFQQFNINVCCTKKNSTGKAVKREINKVQCLQTYVQHFVSFFFHAQKILPLTILWRMVINKREIEKECIEMDEQERRKKI